MTINYSKQVLLKRGNTAVSSTYVGPLGEVTYDTDLHQIRVHDGERAGGWIVPGGPEYDLLVPLIGNAATQQTQINSLFANANVQQAFIESIVNQGNVDPGTGNETFWFNTEDGRLYIKQANVWVDSSPAELPNPSYVTGIMSDFAGNIIPAANVTYSLGTQQAQWKDLWVSNNTIYIGNTPITVSNGSLLVGGNVISGGGGNVFNQNLNTGDSVTFNSVGATVINVSQINGTNPGDELVIQANNRNWTFGTDGNLTLPQGGDILDSTGASVLGGGGTYGNVDVADYLSNYPGQLVFTSSVANISGLDIIRSNEYQFANGVSILSGIGSASTGNIVLSGTGIGLDQGTRDAENTYLNISPNPEGWAFLQLPNDFTANTANTRLWNAAGNVEIGSGDFSTGSNSHAWTFGTDGRLAFPSDLTIGSNPFNPGTVISQANALMTVVTTGNAATYIGWGEFGNGEPGNIAVVAFNDDAGVVAIQTGATTGPEAFNEWIFDAAGNLTLPGKLWARASDSGSIAFSNDGITERGYLKVDAGYNMVVNAESNFSVKRNGSDRLAITDTTSDFKATTDLRFVSNLAGSNETWTFESTGILTLPSNSYIETTDANLKVGSQGTVTIRSNAATLEGIKSWTFGTDGATTFPGNITVPGNLSTIAGFEFYNGDPIAIVATATINSLSFAEPYYIEIRKTGLPAGFDALLGSGAWTVTANGLTLTVVSVVTNGDSWRITVAENPNGTISTIATFNRAASGANIVIPSSGSINFANGVSILSTVGTYSNTNVAAYLTTATITTTGNITAGNITTGNIIFSDATTQNTAYKRVTGSWTVTAGTNNYSFTVPVNGTYTMWVRGNIPDGILAWNATATVTNNNVPVIGQQFAWNYTDAGTPISLTALPHQFVGTSNTIITTVPSVGTSTNTFVFGISNTTGAAQTVYWGYVVQ